MNLPAVGSVGESDDTGSDSDEEGSDSAGVDILGVQQGENNSDQNPSSHHLIEK